MDEQDMQQEGPSGTTKGGLDRRAALQRVAAGGIGAAVISAMGMAGLAASSTPARAQGALSDVQILNFALNLEYLEAEYYARAVGIGGLPAGATTGYGTHGTVTGGSPVPFSTVQGTNIALRIAVDELSHVAFLRSALGAAAAAEPSIDLQTSFTTAAVAAGLIPSGQTFNPFASEEDFLLGAYIFEDVGVTAYNGAIPLISSTAYLSAASSILGTEAYHSGAIRAQLGSLYGNALIFAQNATVAISALRAKLSGVPDFGLVVPAGVSGAGLTDNISNVNQNGLVYARTPGQVLAIVYGGGTNSGLFFPNGINPGPAG